MLWFAISRIQYNFEEEWRHLPHLSIGICSCDRFGTLGITAACTGYRKSMLCHSAGSSWLPQWETTQFWTCNGKHTFCFHDVSLNRMKLIIMFAIQIVDPWGKIIAECDKNDSTVPQCQTANISLESLLDIRKRLPCFDHRRDDIYALAPVRMITAKESLVPLNAPFTPIPVVKEETPYFRFENNPVAKSTTFLETPSSIAFTNIRCVVPGRKLNLNHRKNYAPFNSWILFVSRWIDVLVATRRCVSRLKDLRPDEVIDFFSTVWKCQRMLDEYYHTTSSTVTVQDGEFAGQTVKVI